MQKNVRIERERFTDEIMCGLVNYLTDDGASSKLKKRKFY